MPTDDPGFRGILIPLLCSLLVTALGLLVGWGVLPGRRLRRRGAALCLGLAVGGGTALGWFLLEGAPTFPPPQAKQKCFYALLAALGVGIAADVSGSRRLRRAVPVAAGLAGVTLLWIAWRPLLHRFDAGLLLQLVAVAVGSVAVLLRLARLSRHQRGVGVLAALIPSAVALAGIALFGSSITLTLFAGSLAAAAGGAALAVYAGILAGLPGSAAPASTSLWMGGGLAAISIGTVLVLFTPGADRMAVALAAVIPWASAVVPASRGATRRARSLYPLALIGAGAAAAAAAVSTAWLRSP